MKVSVIFIPHTAKVQQRQNCALSWEALVCSQTHRSPRTLIDCGVIFLFSQAAKRPRESEDKEDLDWGKHSCFVSFCVCSVWMWHKDFSGGSLWSVLRCCVKAKVFGRTEFYATLAWPPPLVMTNGKGHTLAVFVPDAASCSVMDSPLCHHHLLLGPGRNQ